MKKPLTKLPLGQRVRFTQILKRQYVRVPENFGFNPDIDIDAPLTVRMIADMKSAVRNAREFESSDYLTHRDEVHWLPEDLPAAKEGVVVGYRTLQNGSCITEAYGERHWRTSSTVQGALVSYNLHRKPVFVPLSALERLGT